MYTTKGKILTMRPAEEVIDHIRSNEYLAFLKANADAVAYGTYSCSCKDTIDSGEYNACNLSCQITRLATLNAAMVILTSHQDSDGDGLSDAHENRIRNYTNDRNNRK